MDTWNADIHKAVCIVEERHVTVERSESSYVSFDRVDDTWPCFFVFAVLLDDDGIFPSFVLELQRFPCLTQLG